MTLDANTGEVLDDLPWPKGDFLQYEQQPLPGLGANGIETVRWWCETAYACAIDVRQGESS